MAMQRLGKDVVDLEDVSVVFDNHQVLDHITWRIAPGERTGILGVNGAGKSTLLSLVSGSLVPTSGRVKRGKTVKVATLTQRLDELESVQNDRVSAVIAEKKTSYSVGGKEMTPGQLLERLGFTSAQLSTPIKDLSGGQKRRLQLLLILLDEPNVLILDEPTNDLDTDMLVAMEDVLDTWPGTLLVISHDRYLLERITDQQYAVMNANFIHLPGGVDQYLTLRASQLSGPDKPTAVSPQKMTSSLSGAELRNAQKESAAIERKMAKLQQEISDIHDSMAQHDTSDFEGLAQLNQKIVAREQEISDLEVRWLELSELLDN
jgi:ATPase subunit of ABC transporter with duplicated ATPase domains